MSPETGYNKLFETRRGLGLSRVDSREPNVWPTRRGGGVVWEGGCCWWGETHDPFGKCLKPQSGQQKKSIVSPTHETGNQILAPSSGHHGQQQGGNLPNRELDHSPSYSL